MTRALVIGGRGFVGAYVVRALSGRGCDVGVFTRGDRYDALEPPLPDLVIHLAAMNEADAQAAGDAFAGKVGRLVVASSGDVYRAYGRFTGLEPGPPEPMPLTEDAPLRERLYPYRRPSTAADDPLFHYEKILVERALLGRRGLDAVVARLPKVYGPERNADFASVHRYAHQPHWRWTHSYVKNVAAALALIGLALELRRRIYNVGEAHTPSVAERLRDLPPSPIAPDRETPLDFRQDMVMASGAIRVEVGFAEPVEYREGVRRTLAGVGAHAA